MGVSIKNKHCSEETGCFKVEKFWKSTKKIFFHKRKKERFHFFKAMLLFLLICLVG